METVETVTDLDTGREEVRLLNTVEEPRIVLRDADPPPPGQRYTGNQELNLRDNQIAPESINLRSRGEPNPGALQKEDENLTDVPDGYPRKVSQVETVEIITDLDSGLEEVWLLNNPEPPKVVLRDADPPLAGTRISGNQRISVRGRTISSQPIRIRKKSVSDKRHPYAALRRRLRQAALAGR